MPTYYKRGIIPAFLSTRSGHIVNKPTNSLTYEQAGVNIDAGNKLVENLKPLVKRTHSTQVLAGLGGFGALFALPTHYTNPVLVSSTDGVGTKLALAQTLGLHDTIGIDLVGMCVNDVIVMGAKPLFFLDYYATGSLSVEVATQVIGSIAKGCEIAQTALIGGETAEMPGFYQHAEYDLAGFCVGVVEKDQIIDGSRVRTGDQLIALPSSGIHANGFSLVRKIIAASNADYTLPFEDSTLGEILLAPTKIYVQALMPLFDAGLIHAAAHITGGGLTENLPRVLPQNTYADLDCSTWTLSPVFEWLRQHGKVQQQEMLRTFNCGIGMILCVAPENVSRVLDALTNQGEAAFVVGSIKDGEGEPYVEFTNLNQLMPEFNHV